MYPSCCRTNSVNLYHHLAFEFVIFQVPDKGIILGICVHFILKLMLWPLIWLREAVPSCFLPEVWKKLSGLLAGLN